MDSPPHIAAHLQGTQNPPHKSQPCKRVAIANTRQTVFGATDYTTTLQIFKPFYGEHRKKPN